MSKNELNKNSMSVYFLLDRSGSMANLWSEAISSINSYVKNLYTDQLVNPDQPDAKIIVAIFDSEYEIIRNTTLSKWIDLAPHEAYPRGGTALYDSAAKMITRALEDNDEKAVFITMTDGEENISKEYNPYTFKLLLNKFESKGYQVVFLGANFNVTKEASKVGIGIGQTMSFAPNMFNKGMDTVLSATASYRATGSSINFTDTDRAKVAK